MKVVLDVCVPEPFRHHISGHEVVTARLLGLSSAEDGAVLSAVEGEWDVLVTCDRGIPWQSQFVGRDIALIVLCARTNKLQDLVTPTPDLLIALNSIEPGEVLEIP